VGRFRGCDVHFVACPRRRALGRPCCGIAPEIHIATPHATRSLNVGDGRDLTGETATCTGYTLQLMQRVPGTCCSWGKGKEGLVRGGVVV